MNKGIIYVMVSAVEGLIKIGRTNNFENRMTELERNGYFNVAGLKRRFAIEVEDYEQKEELLHNLFSKSRVGQSEMFSLDVNQVIQLLSSFNGKIIYPINSTNEDVFTEVTEVIEIKNFQIPDGIYTMKGSGSVVNYDAKMEILDGKFILKAGSIISPSLQFSNGIDTHNNALIYDVLCTSPSNAASMVAGNSRNGWVSWKDKNGNFINVYRNK